VRARQRRWPARVGRKPAWSRTRTRPLLGRIVCLVDLHLGGHIDRRREGRILRRPARIGRGILEADDHEPSGRPAERKDARCLWIGRASCDDSRVEVSVCGRAWLLATIAGDPRSLVEPPDVVDRHSGSHLVDRKPGEMQRRVLGRDVDQPMRKRTSARVRTPVLRECRRRCSIFGTSAAGDEGERAEHHRSEPQRHLVAEPSTRV